MPRVLYQPQTSPIGFVSARGALTAIVSVPSLLLDLLGPISRDPVHAKLEFIDAFDVKLHNRSGP
jgi:hypothetical protein